MEKNGVALVNFVEAMVAKQNVNKGNALVLGCGGGLSSFILTKTFQKVCTIWNQSTLTFNRQFFSAGSGRGIFWTLYQCCFGDSVRKKGGV